MSSYETISIETPYGTLSKEEAETKVLNIIKEIFQGSTSNRVVSLDNIEEYELELNNPELQFESCHLFSDQKQIKIYFNIRTGFAGMDPHPLELIMEYYRGVKNSFFTWDELKKKHSENELTKEELAIYEEFMAKKDYLGTPNRINIKQSGKLEELRKDKDFRGMNDDELMAHIFEFPTDGELFDIFVYSKFDNINITGNERVKKYEIITKYFDKIIYSLFKQLDSKYVYILTCGEMDYVMHFYLVLEKELIEEYAKKGEVLHVTLGKDRLIHEQLYGKQPEQSMITKQPKKVLPKKEPTNQKNGFIHKIINLFK